MSSQKQKSTIIKGFEDFWHNCVLSLKVTFYILVIIFFVIGVLALLYGAVGLGIVLMVFNALLFYFFLRMDKKADSRFNEEFAEMVKRNRKED